jgi:hypothetical protein
MKGSVFLVLLAGVVCLFVSNVDSQVACCKKFTPAQEVFLRKLLQEEAKGLRAGMMQTFSTPKGKIRMESFHIHLQSYLVLYTVLWLFTDGFTRKI